MHRAHMCHSAVSLYKLGVHAYLQIIDRAAHSSSQRSRYGLATSSSQLPIRTGNARWISSPSGRCFCMVRAAFRASPPHLRRFQAHSTAP
ncbi:hypothetical protein NXT3_CH01612 [Sinorhizobium fredii]|uniref:Uncharacterized protein n=1 Tax=Rhizobium fredii TaxID=380 RepID=A0A2L0H400_RHIFR|nr:hypothetical protein NXT3_CH01612 [Sinorhizobium fredii]